MDSPNPKPPTSLLLRLLHHPSNKHIAHLQRILSTASGIDTTLLLIGYTFTLIQSQLAALLNLRLSVLAERVAANASKTLSPGETIIATLQLPSPTSRLADVQVGMKTFAGMCSDVRAFMRLWSLLGIWAWARRVASDGPRDGVLRAVAWGQVAANAGYLLCEHPSYLAGKGVLPGWSPERIRRGWIWAGRFFAAHVAMDFVRMWRVNALRVRQGDVDEKEVKLARAEEDRLWWKTMYVDLAYSPLCVHWSVPGGFVNESWYGGLGMIAGIAGFRELWRQTA